MDNITGNRYGRLLVLKRVKNDKWSHACWQCRCDCGNIVVVIERDLRRKHTKSCGCLRKELVIKNELGNRYSKLVVLKRSKNTREGTTTWLCQCDCGNKTVVRGANLRNENTKSCGCLKKGVGALPEGEAAFNKLFHRYEFATAGKRGLSWELTKHQFRKLVTSTCYYCGIEPSQDSFDARLNGGFVHNGLDRIDPSVGYVEDNVVPCCKRCNYAKHIMSEKEFANWIVKVYDFWASGFGGHNGKIEEG